MTFTVKRTKISDIFWMRFFFHYNVSSCFSSFQSFYHLCCCLRLCQSSGTEWLQEEPIFFLFYLGLPLWCWLRLFWSYILLAVSGWAPVQISLVLNITSENDNVVFSALIQHLKCAKSHLFSQSSMLSSWVTSVSSDSESVCLSIRVNEETSVRMSSSMSSLDL